MAKGIGMTKTQTNPPPNQSAQPKREADPQLVRQIAEKVYALLLADWQLLQERKRNY